MISIAIVDDIPALRLGLKYILEPVKDFKIIIEAENGDALLNVLGSGNIQLDVCILDLSMPVLNGYETLRILQERYPTIRVIILTVHYNEFAVIKTLREGAKSCLPKEVSPEELELAIKEVVSKGYYYTDFAEVSMSKATLNNFKDIVLNDRHLEFLRYCCTDLTYKQIAEQMKLSHKTIDGYREDLFKRLSLKSRVELAVFALQSGIYTTLKA